MFQIPGFRKLVLVRLREIILILILSEVVVEKIVVPVAGGEMLEYVEFLLEPCEGGLGPCLRRYP